MSATAIMTSTIPRTPLRPPQPPPSGPLPALPVSKCPSPAPSASADSPSASAIPTPARRSVTASALPTLNTKATSTPAVPSLVTANGHSAAASVANSPVSATGSASASALPAPRKTVRKTISVGAFPPPPKNNRVTSLSHSPLAASFSASATDVSSLDGAVREPLAHRNKSGDGAANRKSGEGVGKKLRSRGSGYGLRSRPSIGSTSPYGQSPSLLHGNADSSLVSSAERSNSLPGLLYPPQSRSSSVDGSFVTEGTQFEDGTDEADRGRATSAVGSSAHSDVKDGKGNVLVSVRVRPDASGDPGKTDGQWTVDGRRSLISFHGREGGDHRYDNVFSPHDHNARVYDNAAKRLVRRVMEGYHGTVFAYGMTGTGKTFSMQGTSTSPGVIPLAITDIFSYIRENPNREFLLRVSYLEIYNEKIYDLLSQSTPGHTQEQEIKLREDSKRGVYATPLKEEIVQSPNQLLRVIARGDVARRTSSTQFNARSSRSHAVVQVVVESRARAAPSEYFQKEQRRIDTIVPGGVLVSTLSLIDLAGSERAAESKERRTEGAHINKSLLTLGTVIARLSGEDEKEGVDDKKTPKDRDKATKHLPYRDSKLTRLLQPALSGDSLVSILCTIQLSAVGTSAAAAGLHTGETLNTLKFASRAKNNLVSHAKRNESHANAGDPNSRALLDRYRIEIQELRNQLEQQSKTKDDAVEGEMEKDRRMEEELERQEHVRHEEQMLEMQLARTALKERISHLNRLILSSKSLGVNSSSSRFSSASVPMHRISSISHAAHDFGRPVSIRSGRSSTARDRPDSSATLEVPHPHDSGDRTLTRAISITSLTAAPPPPPATDDDAAASSPASDLDGPAGDGEASLLQRNKALQSDLADKTRYIATLEKRLLQARRTSQSRASAHIAATAARSITPDVALADQLRDRDREIAALRKRVDDQARMLGALHNAARARAPDPPSDRKTPLAGRADDPARRASASAAVRSGSAGPARAAAPAAAPPAAAVTAPPPPPVTSAAVPPLRSMSSRASVLSARGHAHARSISNARGPGHAPARSIGHVSNASTVSRSSSIVARPSLPASFRSPTASLGSLTAATTPPPPTAGAATALPSASPPPPPHPASPRPAPANDRDRSLRRRSVDEMTLLLDQMIQDKVASGYGGSYGVGGGYGTGYGNGNGNGIGNGNANGSANGNANATGRASTRLRSAVNATAAHAALGAAPPLPPPPPPVLGQAQVQMQSRPDAVKRDTVMERGDGDVDGGDAGGDAGADGVNGVHVNGVNGTATPAARDLGPAIGLGLGLDVAPESERRRSEVAVAQVAVNKAAGAGTDKVVAAVATEVAEVDTATGAER